MRTGVTIAAAVFLVACGLVAVAMNQETFFSHDMQTTQLVLKTELDTIKVHVPGSGTSIIHAGRGKAVHEYEVNTKGLPDVAGSLKALSAEVGNLKSHVRHFAYKAAKAQATSGAPSDDEVKALANKVQGLVTSMNARYPAASVKPRSGSQMVIEAEHVSKLVEQVKALAHVVDKRFIGPNGKPKCSPAVVLKLIRAVDELGQQVRMSLPNGNAGGGVPGATLSAQNIVDAATIVNAARRAQHQVADAQHARDKLMLAVRRSENMASSKAAVDSIIAKAAKSAKSATKNNMAADRSDASAAKASIQAAEASASTVASGKSKRSAKDAAEIAAGAITSANILDRAIQSATAAAKTIKEANDLSAKLIEEQKQAAKTEKNRLAPGIAKIIKASKGDTQAALQATADAAKAENAVTRIAVASSDSKKTAAAAVAAADVAGAKAGAAVMSDNNLRAAKQISQMDAAAYLNEAKRLAQQLARVTQAQKACAATISKSKTLERRNSGTSATSTDDIAAAKNAANSVADQRGRKAKDAAGEDAAAAAAAAELNTAKEAAARLATANEAAARVACANLELIKKQIAKLALSAANAARIAAHNVQAANSAAHSGRATDAARISGSIASAALHTAMIKAKADGHAAHQAYLHGMADVRKAKRAADLISQAVAQANKDMKDDELAAETAARKVDKIQNAAQNALNAENAAAAAAAADGSPDIAAADAAAAKVAREHVKEGKPSAADVNAASQALDANRRAVRAGDKIAVNSLSAAADAAAVLAGANNANAKALAAFHKGTKAELQHALNEAEKRTQQLRKMSGQKNSVASVSEKRNAQAEEAAEKAAAAALLGGNSNAAINPDVVLAAVRRSGVPVDAANIIAALKKAGVALTPASIAAALKNAGLSAEHIARILKAMGIPAQDIAKSLSSAGVASDPASIARAMAAAGLSPQEIASALSNSGLASNIQSIQQALKDAGLKLSADDIRKAIASNVSANPGPIPITDAELRHPHSGIPSKAADIIAALRKAGVALTPENIAAALRKAGLSAADIATTFAAMNVPRSIAAEAMKKAGIPSADIVAAMKKSMASVALSGDHKEYMQALRNVNPKAADIIEQMRKAGIALTPANIAAALKKAGLPAHDISSALLAMGVRPDVAQTAMVQSGFSPTQAQSAVDHSKVSLGLSSSYHRLSQDAQDVIAGLRRGGVPLTPENIAAAMRKAGMSPTEIAAAMATLGNSPSAIKQAMVAAGVPAFQVDSALQSPSVQKALKNSAQHFGGSYAPSHGQQHAAAYTKYGQAFAKYGYLPSQMSKLSPRARDAIDKLMASGKSMSQANMVAALKAAGLSPAEIAAELARLGMQPADLKTALQANGYSSAEVTKAMADPRVVAGFKAASTERLHIASSGGAHGSGPQMSKQAQSIIAQMQRDGIPLTPANIVAALRKAGLSATDMAHTLATMGITPSGIQSALESAGLSAAQINEAMNHASVQQVVKYHAAGGHSYGNHAGLHGGAVEGRPKMPSEASAIIEALRKQGVPLTPENIAEAMRKAGLPASQMAEALLALGVNPQTIGEALKKAGVPASEINAALKHPSVAKYIQHEGGMPVQAHSIIDAMKQAGVPMTPENIIARLKASGMSTADMMATLLSMGFGPSSVRAALTNAGVSHADITRAMSDPSVQRAMAASQVNGMPREAVDIIDQLKQSGKPLTPENIIAALRAKGLSASDIAKTLTSLGINPDVAAKAMQQAGYPNDVIRHAMHAARGMPSRAVSVIEQMRQNGTPMTAANMIAALKAKGLTPAEIMRTLLANGINPKQAQQAMQTSGYSSAQIAKALADPQVQQAVKNFVPGQHTHLNLGPQLSPGSRSVLDALKKSGKPMTPENIIAAMRAQGLPLTEIMQALASLGVNPSTAKQALMAAGVSPSDIQAAMNDPVVQRAMVAAGFAAGGIPHSAVGAIEELKRSGQPMTPANIIAALKAKGLSPAEIMQTMLSMGINAQSAQAAMQSSGYSPSQIQAALADPKVQAAIKNFNPAGGLHHHMPHSARDAIEQLKASGQPMTPANIIAALKAKGLSPAEIMQAMISMGINTQAAQAAMQSSGYSATEIAAALANPKVQAAIQASGAPGIPSGALSAIEQLKASGQPMTPANIIAALKAKGLSPAEIMQTMISMGINTQSAQAAMQSAGYSPSQIQAALADPKVQAAIQASTAAGGAAVTQPQFVAQAAQAGCAPCQAVAACAPGCAPLQIVQPCAVPLAAPQPIACAPARLSTTAALTQLQNTDTRIEQ
jgi:lambda repressor-like predicted transcriptional regulator